MKVCLVSFTAPYTIPYIDIYLKKIKELNLECDIIFWDRDGNGKEIKKNKIHYIPFSSMVKQGGSKVKKYLQYIPVTLFIRKYLKKNNYDKIIFLQTHTAVACKDILLKKYLKKYLIDIRDFTLENYKWFKKIEKSVIENSFCTVISSKGYEAFLPKYKYTIAHNYTPVDEEMKKKIINKKYQKNCINISFIGYVRFYEMAKKLLLLFANDSRFHISYIGTGANVLEEFCIRNKIENVTLHDRFSPEETATFYYDCDLINNLYGNHNNYLDFALSNKLYYAAELNIPVLVSEDTYSSRIAEEYNIGISWNPDEEDAVNKLYKKICSFDINKMKRLSSKFIKKVIEENKNFENEIEEFLKS